MSKLHKTALHMNNIIDVNVKVNQVSYDEKCYFGLNQWSTLDAALQELKS